ncbi:hypothetical protein CYMTET_39098 [Cymbomonas tetramitiformis]|uniref:Uncharacterized protein n=1 Tax=Cymbomonas tetramitiformis TaxID=36881 RepID=A0AAE0CAR0_9CHLO|nr:hypothetical protein CYMTET_39098 [Cymbomonas tetramitiformis]
MLYPSLCFLGTALQIITPPFLHPSAKVSAPELSRFTGKYIFLTAQGNTLGFIFFTLNLYAEISNHVPLKIQLAQFFPTIFGLGTFITLGYYLLDHYNPVAIKRRVYYSRHGYPYIEYAVNLEHLFGILVVVLHALTFDMEVLKAGHPSFQDYVTWTLGFLMQYVILAHLNVVATGHWPYPFIDDITKASGVAGRSAFFLLLCSIVMGFGYLGLILVRSSGP